VKRLLACFQKYEAVNYSADQTRVPKTGATLKALQAAEKGRKAVVSIPLIPPPVLSASRLIPRHHMQLAWPWCLPHGFSFFLSGFPSSTEIEFHGWLRQRQRPLQSPPHLPAELSFGGHRSKLDQNRARYNRQNQQTSNEPIATLSVVPAPVL